MPITVGSCHKTTGSIRVNGAWISLYSVHLPIADNLKNLQLLGKTTLLAQTIEDQPLIHYFS